MERECIRRLDGLGGSSLNQYKVIILQVTQTQKPVLSAMLPGFTCTRKYVWQAAPETENSLRSPVLYFSLILWQQQRIEVGTSTQRGDLKAGKGFTSSLWFAG